MREASPTIDQLKARFEQLGFGVSDCAFFGACGLWVFQKPALAPGQLQVSEGWVFLYPTEGGWTVRVTPHGGPHWISERVTMNEIEALALPALKDGQQRWAPSDGWSVAP